MRTHPSATPWRTAEFVLESAAPHPSPYRDVDVDVDFRGPDGRRVRRQAFWDGGRTWRVRFAPPAVGIWRWTSSTGAESIEGLDQQSGVVECVEWEGDLAVFRHGFLRVDPSGRHLSYADGAPFFWLGDTHWRFLFESWDDANKPGWSSQFRDTVDLRVAQGFTVYQSNLLSFGARWREMGLGDPQTGDIDPAFFRRVVDPRMAYVADAGLVHAMGLAWYSAILETGAVEWYERLARYLVARYGSYPMVWTLAGEVAGYEPAERRRLVDSWRRVALAIEDADGYGQLQTAHSTAARPFTDDYEGEPWFDLTLNQLGHGDLDMDVSHYADHLGAHPAHPVVEGESMYEGLNSVESLGRRRVTATMVRHVAYRAVQSGCCGYSYGAQGCWNNAWDHGDTATHWGDVPWYEGVDLPGGAQMGVLRAFYESVPWTDLRPAPEAFSSVSWLNDALYRPAVAADDRRRTVVVYFGETYRMLESPASLVGLSADRYRMRWHDPRLGRDIVVAEGVDVVDGALELPGKPDAQDWLLAVEACP